MAKVNNSGMSDLLKKIGNQSWWKDLYGSQRSEQQGKLKQLFKTVEDNTVTSAEKKKLDSEQEKIEDKLERLEAKMAVLEEQLAANQDKVDQASKEIMTLVQQATNATKKEAEYQEDQIEKIVESLLNDLKHNPNSRAAQAGPDGFAGVLASAMAQRGLGDKVFAEIQLDFETKINSKKSEISALVSKIDGWMNQRRILSSQHGATKSAYDLLSGSVAKIGATETAYTNSDFNNNVPVYSPQKAGLVAKYAEDPTINVAAGPNKHYEEGAQAPNIQSVDDLNKKYEGLFGTKSTANVDPYSANNQAVKNLGAALDKGLINDLASLGLSGGQVQQFLADNFGGAKISVAKGANGAITKFNVPYGHGAEAQKIFTKLTTQLKGYNEIYEGKKNNWDPNEGNTIDSNNQIASLANNYEKIIKDMGCVLTFKEAMYALFDPEKGIFKDTGFEYNLDEQTGTPNYKVAFAGDKETAEMYKNVAKMIYDTWGVKPNRGAGFELYDDEYDPGEGSEPNRTDPLSFSLGGDSNNKYSFVIDRENDGAFSGSQDFVGGTQDKSWLEDLKSFDTNNDGKLTGDELKNLKVLGTRYTMGDGEKDDKNEYVPDKNPVDHDGFNRESTSNVYYTLQSAASLGITEIDLTQDMKVNDSTGKFDINGSEKFNDSFTFMLGDDEVTAKRTDDLPEFMQAVYSAAYGKNFSIGFNEADADEVIKKSYAVYDAFENKYSDLFTKLNALKNIDGVKAGADAEMNKIKDATNNYVTIKYNQGIQKAKSVKNENGNWNSDKFSIQVEIEKAGYQYNEEIAEGIYIIKNGSSTETIETYIEQAKGLKEAEDTIRKSDQILEVMQLLMNENLVASPARIEALLDEGKSPNEIIEILKEELTPVTEFEPYTEWDIPLNGREQEFYEAFNKRFGEKGPKVLEAMEVLRTMIRQDSDYTEGKTAEQIANAIAKRIDKK